MVCPYILLQDYHWQDFYDSGDVGFLSVHQAKIGEEVICYGVISEGVIDYNRFRSIIVSCLCSGFGIGSYVAGHAGVLNLWLFFMQMSSLFVLLVELLCLMYFLCKGKRIH